MATYPKKEKGARTGSSRGDDRLLAYRSKALESHNLLFRREARDYQRRCKEVLSRADRRTVADIVRRTKADWYQADLAVASDPAKRDALKLRARQTVNRLLGRALPGFRRWRAIRQAHLTAHRRLTKRFPGGVISHPLDIGWGGVLPPAAAETQEFVAPFPDYDVHTVDWDELIVYDESFALPDIGHMVNNIIFKHRNDAWPLSYNPTLFAYNLASCGIFFTMPRPGRLQITGVLQNIYNKIIFSVRDNFGFSHANLHIDLNVFIAILRQTGVIHLSKNLASEGIVSHGSDFTFSRSDLDDTTPYIVEGKTKDPLLGGEPVRILIGSEVGIFSEVDDMESYVNAVLWWQLKKMTVAVV